MFIAEKKWVFTSIFVGVFVFISWSILPGYQPIASTLVAVLATILGANIGEKIFSDKS